MGKSILEEAQELIHGDRNVAYGHPRDNFAAIAAQWNAYLKHKNTDHVTSQDVANMMILMKVARVNGGSYHRDSYTDIAGYAGTAERLQEPVEYVETMVVAGYQEPLAEWEKELLAPSPRQWDSLADVPKDVKVFDREGDYWTFYGESWGFGHPGEIARNPVNTKRFGEHSWDHFGPFTEVVDG